MIEKIQLSGLRKFCWLFATILLSGASSIADAQTAEKTKSCEFKDVGLQFESKLIRSQKILVGYEVKIKNVGVKNLLGFEHPLLPGEVAYANIYEIPPDRSRRTLVSAPLRIYPMHAPPEMQQRRFSGQLGVGEEKSFFVKMEDAFRDGYVGKFDYLYDLRIGINFTVRPPDVPYAEAASRYGAVESKVAFGGCLSFSDVRLSEPSGR